MDSSTKLKAEATRIRQTAVPANGAVSSAEAEYPPLSFYPLTYRELRRRFWHMAPGLLAFGLHIFPHADPMSGLMVSIVLGCCLVLGGGVLLGFQKIRRQGEGVGTSAVAGYALSVLLTTLMFPQHLEIGLAVLAILAFGDGSATLTGLWLRGPRLPWNKGKSWAGFCAFVLIGSVMTAWIYWGETHNPEAADPSVTFLKAVALTSPAVFAAAVAESVRSKVNNNIRVGVTASIVLAAMHIFR